MTSVRTVPWDVLEDAENPEANVMRFASAGRDAITNWWTISPGAVVEMLTRLGFGRTHISYHSQQHHLGHRLDEAPIAMSMFTVVGERV